MSDGHRPSEFRIARQASGLLSFFVAGALALLDAFRADFDVNPVVLVIFVVGGLALFAVPIPKLPLNGGQ